eukprot:scaffold84278_cov35-Tisochrysis_lutea.AAC.2
MILAHASPIARPPLPEVVRHQACYWPPSAHLQLFEACEVREAAPQPPRHAGVDAYSCQSAPCSISTRHGVLRRLEVLTQLVCLRMRHLQSLSRCIALRTTLSFTPSAFSRGVACLSELELVAEREQGALVLDLQLPEAQVGLGGGKAERGLPSMTSPSTESSSRMPPKPVGRESPPRRSRASAAADARKLRFM